MGRSWDGLSRGAADDGEQRDPVTAPERLAKNLGLILIFAAWSALFVGLVQSPSFCFSPSSRKLIRQETVVRFVPTAKDLPVFGPQLANKMALDISSIAWILRLGVVMGPKIVLHMLTSAIVGRGILSPYAKAGASCMLLGESMESFGQLLLSSIKDANLGS